LLGWLGGDKLRQAAVGYVRLVLGCYKLVISSCRLALGCAGCVKLW